MSDLKASNLSEREALNAVLYEIRESRKDMKALTKSINRLIEATEVTVE